MGPEVGMRRDFWISTLLITVLFLGRPGLAGDAVVPQSGETKAEPEQAATNGSKEGLQDSAVESSPETYVPPRWGVPRAKVGGGLRYGPQGASGALPVLRTLAPEQLARTISASPALFWHIGSVPDDGAQLVFYLTDDRLTEPVAEIELASPQRAGIQRIDLAAHGVELHLEVEYDWAVVLVVDPERRSRDLIANAYIRRVPTPPGLSEGGCSFERCVEEGLWYDALTAISDAIQAAPADTALREQRNQLLRQAGLEVPTEGGTTRSP